jgi:hypothetical protein
MWLLAGFTAKIDHGVDTVERLYNILIRTKTDKVYNH